MIIAFPFPTTFSRLSTSRPTHTMPNSNGADNFDGRRCTPSPTLSSMQLSTHLSGLTPFLSQSGISSLRDIDSSPFSATTRSVSQWNDKSDVFSNRQQYVSSGLYMPGEEGSSSPTTPILHRRDPNRRLGQHGSDQIYASGHAPRGLTRDSYPYHFPVSAQPTLCSYGFYSNIFHSIFAE